MISKQNIHPWTDKMTHPSPSLPVSTHLLLNEDDLLLTSYYKVATGVMWTLIQLPINQSTKNLNFHIERKVKILEVGTLKRIIKYKD